MYKIEIYETSSGNKPYEKYLKVLTKQHKYLHLAQIKNKVNELSQYGLNLNMKEKNAIKPIREGVYELRVLPSRIFFIYVKDNIFVILHGFEKKSNKTPPNEIEKAIKEKNDYKMRFGK